MKKYPIAAVLAAFTGSALIAPVPVLAASPTGTQLAQAQPQTPPGKEMKKKMPPKKKMKMKKGEEKKA